MISIDAENLTIEFPVLGMAHRSFRSSLLHRSTGGRIAADAGRAPAVRALDGLSLHLKPGDRLGISGHNGAGKSTLLRALAGIYAPTAGSLRVNGSLSSLLDVSLGMDDNATGRENILMRGVMMGLYPAEMVGRTDEIAEFSGLGDFLDLPMRTYSSGMRMRLAFAISTAVPADIILMDEWLAVGDAEFQAKATARLSAMIDQSHILVLASHSHDLVRWICNRGIELQAGKIVSAWNTTTPTTG